MIEFFLDNYQYILIGFYVAEKIVKESSAAWDDILVDGVKSIVKSLYSVIGRP